MPRSMSTNRTLRCVKYLSHWHKHVYHYYYYYYYHTRVARHGISTRIHDTGKHHTHGQRNAHITHTGAAQFTHHTRAPGQGVSSQPVYKSAFFWPFRFFVTTDQRIVCNVGLLKIQSFLSFHLMKIKKPCYESHIRTVHLRACAAVSAAKGSQIFRDTISTRN
jgi:hypothetical protein